MKKYFIFCLFLCPLIIGCNSVPKGPPTQNEMQIILKDVFKKAFEYQFTMGNRSPDSIQIVKFESKQIESGAGAYVYDMTVLADADLPNMRAAGGSKEFPLQIEIVAEGQDQLKVNYARSQRFPFFNYINDGVPKIIYNRRYKEVELIE